MKSRVLTIGVIIFAFVLIGGAFAQAQAQAQTIKVGFEFIAAGKTLKAGNYVLDVTANGNVTIAPEAGGAAIEMPKMKTISSRNVDRAELIFDRLGSALFLSEVWLPGKGGLMVAKVDTGEDREFVKGPKIKK